MRRMTEVDALRGLAALAVMAFHYTTKYDELFRFVGDVPFHVPWGYLGVNLFFVISGFVIFMTLERTRMPMDFVVSRASRLYPTYWAAIVVTVLITRWLGLPGKEPSWHVAVLNILMFQGLFSVPPVDGVYWTLLVELLFYSLAFLLYVTRQMHRVLHVLCALLCLRLIYWAFAEFAHVDLPWRIRELLVLDFIAFFAMGIVAFRLVRDRGEHYIWDLFTVVLAIAVIAITESMLLATVGSICFIAVWLAALGRLPVLQLRPLVWFGSISYPLYLLHENVGWAVLRQLQMHGWTPLEAIGATTMLVIALAAVLSRTIERPSMNWIRAKYRQSRLQETTRGTF